MAAPIIDSMDAPASVQPGAAFVVTILAHDPDQAVGTLTGRVVDSLGEFDTQAAEVTVMDDLTYSLLDTSGLGFAITPRAGEPGVFDVIAPGAPSGSTPPASPSNLSGIVEA